LIDKCPGQDRRYLKVGTLKCASCAYQAEIFSDEVKVACPRCGKLICRQRLLSCVDWCKYARECMGRYDNVR
jgi:predicted RNA-binding Zn-ribbon protein involved in translation (DUF1610 family)